ncbi:MAG TPA: COX15/CtaA family protein [Gemmatimonadaceae bacterium]|nr:COX15/CtaA family protein [Gemmatimonadaceae bacterium]
MSDSARENERAIGRWLALWAAMVGILVLIGGATRLTESGLSITEWQPFAGVIPPIGDAQWTAEFVKYQQIPQFKLLSHAMTLAEFKTIFLWEYIHRLWGRMLGVVLVLIWFVNRRRITRELWPRLLGLLVLLGLQGALGWWMVMSGLSVRTSVSQYRLAAHLLTALALYAFTVWTAAELIEPRGTRAPNADKKLSASIFALALLVPLTAASGAFVAGLHAGKIYNTFPMMGPGLVPPEYSQLQPFWRNLFENPAAVQFNHRLIATTTFILAMCVWFFARRSANSRVVRASRWVLAAVLLQVTLGISTLLASVPVPLGVAHQAGAVLLLTASLLALHANGATASA